MVRSFGWRQGVKIPVEARENLLYRRYLPDSVPGDQNDDSKVVLQLVDPKSLRKAILQHSDVARWFLRCQKYEARKPKKGKRAPLKQETVG